ncbi:MAG: hypothetical protein WC734_04165 [Patescibacteria group bacterium]|jgi:hypothetical protein
MQKIYISIIYNIKHGIEVFIKTVCVQFNVDYPKDGKGHDIKKALNTLYDKSKKDKQKISEWLENEDITKNSPLLATVKDRFFKNWTNNFSDIERLVNKYYYCEFIKAQMLTDYTIQDESNTGFRYPENNLLIKPDYQKIVDRVTALDIKGIDSDIVDLFKNFEIVSFVIEFYRHYNTSTV